jgi:hypothetical protein
MEIRHCTDTCIFYHAIEYYPINFAQVNIFAYFFLNTNLHSTFLSVNGCSRKVIYVWHSAVLDVISLTMPVISCHVNILFLLPQLIFFPKCKWPRFKPVKATGELIILHISKLRIFIRLRKVKNSELNLSIYSPDVIFSQLLGEFNFDMLLSLLVIWNN